MRKKLLILGVLSVIAVPLIAFAALVPCGTSYNPTPCSLCDLFSLGQIVVKFLTETIAPALAVLAFALAGFKILTSGGSPGARQQGIIIIRNTIIGLLIVFGAWIIINELLIFFAGNLYDASGGKMPWDKIICITPLAVAPPIADVAYDKEGSERAQLNTAGIAVKTNYCTTFDTPNPCTTVAQLPATAMSGLINLKSVCGGSSCAMLVTGGTERVGHTSHGPDKAIVDLSYESGSALSNYLGSGNFTITTNPCGRKYAVSGITKVLLEYDSTCSTPHHWHLEF